MNSRNFYMLIASVIFLTASCSTTDPVSSQVAEPIENSESVCDKLGYWIEKIEGETWNLDYISEYRVPGFFFFGMKEDLESAGYSVPDKNLGYDDEIYTLTQVASACLSPEAKKILENSLSANFKE